MDKSDQLLGFEYNAVLNGMFLYDTVTSTPDRSKPFTDLTSL